MAMDDGHTDGGDSPASASAASEPELTNDEGEDSYSDTLAADGQGETDEQSFDEDAMLGGGLHTETSEGESDTLKRKRSPAKRKAKANGEETAASKKAKTAPAAASKKGKGKKAAVQATDYAAGAGDEAEGKDGNGSDSSALTAVEELEEKPKKKQRKPRKPREPKPEPVYVIPDVEKLAPHPTFDGRLGYACLNTILRAKKPPVFCSRTCRCVRAIVGSCMRPSH